MKNYPKNKPTKIFSILLTIALFVIKPAWADTTVGDVDSYIIQVDTDNCGLGTFVVQDFNGSSATRTVIRSNAQTTTFGSDTVAVTNNATVAGTLGVTGAATLSNALAVAGTSTFTGSLTANGGQTINSGSKISSGSEVGNQLVVDGTSARLGNSTNSNGIAINSTGTIISGPTNFNNDTTVTTGNNILSVTSSSNTVSLQADSDSSNMNARTTFSITPTTAALTVNTDTGTAHGVSISQTQTVLSGGTQSTTLTLDDSGATFTNTETGGAARVTGVADASGNFDAVNYKQFRAGMKKAYSGIAAVAALAAIPPPAPGKTFSVGAGYGNYADQNAAAVGVKAIVGKEKNITLSAGLGYANQDYTSNAGISYSW